jgi:polyferredoxin
VALVTVPRITGFFAALVIIALVAWLLRWGRLGRGVRIALLLVSVLLGVLIFSPMTVIAFQVVVLRLADVPGPLLLTIASFLAFIGLTAAFGRIFCGYCCPIGAAQELAYWITCRKVVLRQARWIPLLRAGLITLLIVLALVASVNLLVTSLLVLRGARDAFVASGPSLFLFLFLGVLLLGVFLYRPFCRFACPVPGARGYTLRRDVT